MQTYNIKFDPSSTSTSLFVDANLFVYESGRASTDNANTAVLVKPENGAEIVLKPGQRFRLAPGSNAKTWTVRTLDPAVTLQGAFVIGSGEFDDANTLNKFTFDTGSGALPMLVQNTAANRVPVSVDTNQVISVSQPIMEYTETFYRSTSVPIGVTMVVDPARNVNGIILARYDFTRVTSGSGQLSAMALVAKASTPANGKDGDVLVEYASLPAGGGGIYVTIGSGNDPNQFNGIPATKIPPGRGLYLCASQGMSFTNGGFLNLFLKVL